MNAFAQPEWPAMSSSLRTALERSGYKNMAQLLATPVFKIVTSTLFTRKTLKELFNLSVQWIKQARETQ